MKERPILFSDPMVKALLAGAKTQTRRVVKLRDFGPTTPSGAGWDWDLRDRRGRWNSFTTTQFVASKCNPYGVVGDRLWVREAWSHDAPDLDACRAAHEDAMSGMDYGPYYRATECAPDTLRWRPSIHMPRWASRITLEITEVRVQRLQEISEEDARAEGIPFGEMQDAIINGEPGRVAFFNARDAFAYAWNAINGKRAAWASNPWVWAISFRRLP